MTPAPRPPASFADPAAHQTAIPLWLVAPETAVGWITAQTDFDRAQLSTRPFDGALGDVRTVLGHDGTVAMAVAGTGTAAERARQIHPLGGIASALPAGVYRLAGDPPKQEAEAVALGWLLSGYRFTRYKSRSAQAAELVAPQGVNAAEIEAQAAGVALTQDLINTPANDMGPDQLEQAFRDLAAAHGAKVTAIVGDDLLAQNFPLIHTVGRASDRAPRLLDMLWGPVDGPLITLVGKGVCFDTGGLNLKPGASMGLMKKDMGGAATVLGLAHMIMALDLPVRLRVLIPAVENAVSANAFRPGDILTGRDGTTVEINNTDAEGRLVLADALALAGEGPEPALIVSMATLTGAARVAMGPDVPPFFADDDALAAELGARSLAVSDPLWRLPFWDPYEAMIEPGIADLDNAPKGGFAGAITAALFLRRFVATPQSYVHIDCFGWCPSDQPARPKGGASQGARALLSLIRARFVDG